MNLIPDDLTIPEFLRRDPTEAKPLPVKRRGERKIPYPKDGYACKGMRQDAREWHKARLRRRAERMQQRRKGGEK
jgi:hypothetical protein